MINIITIIVNKLLMLKRIIATAIDIYEKLMLEEEEPSKRTQALVALLRRFSKERITKAR